MSGLFQQVLHLLGIQQFKSSAYHPQSQGILEWFHQTLKNMLRKYCLKEEKEWDEGAHLVLFDARESVQELLKLLKEQWWLTEDASLNLLDYVNDLWTKMSTACKLA